MSKSEKIRELAKSGMSTADIARTLGIRYQFAYGVLRSAGTGIGERSASNVVPAAARPSKPPLLVSDLTTAGFEHVGSWILSPEQRLVIDRALPKAVGVYAFAKGGVVLYVGVATMGLAKRLYFYGRPGVTQRQACGSTPSSSASWRPILRSMSMLHSLQTLNGAVCQSTEAPGWNSA